MHPDPDQAPQQTPQEPALLSAAEQQEALALLERAKSDPYAARELERLRDEVFTAILEIIRETVSMLPRAQPGAEAGQQQLQANSVLALRNLSRQRESISRQRQELAEAMVMGALLNRNNPDWDPFDPTTERASQDSLILALMQVQPETPPAVE